MAGKHIYIETILDNLLGGFQTTFDKMIAAINRMTGHTDEDEGKSLVNVVDGLNEMTEKLDDQIDELQNLVSASSAAITKLLVAKGTDKTQTIGKTDGFVSKSTNQSSQFEFLSYQFLSHANGSLKLNSEIEWKFSLSGLSGSSGNCQYKIFDSDNNIIYTSPNFSTGTYGQFRTDEDTAEFFVEAEKKYSIKLYCSCPHASPSKTATFEAEFRIKTTQFNIVNIINNGALDFA